MIHRCAILLSLIAPASGVSAGPWLQESGGLFVSTSAQLATEEPTGMTASGGNGQMVHVEYGLAPNLTIGVSGSLQDDSGQGQVFARVPLAELGSFRYAGQFGIGRVSPEDEEPSYFLNAGVSAGRGLTLGSRSGWIELDAQAEISPDTMPDVFRLDATLGLMPAPRLRIMGQLQSGMDSSDYSWVDVAPSAIWSFSETLSLEVGAIAPLNGERPTTLVIGTMLDF